MIYFTTKYIQNFDDFLTAIKNYSDLVDSTNENIEEIINNRLNKDKHCHTIVLDGLTFCHYKNLPESLQISFLYLLSSASSCICCRLAPKQKAELVREIKKKVGKITLSVGDGTNDVPMIMEANIGLGISGKEGTQAARAADYSIGKFIFIKDLLLVHGRLGYRKLCFYICYSFYKNIITVLSEIYFLFFNGLSGQIYFSDWFTNLYNTFWSSWPVFINYTLDKDLNRDLSIKYPILYIAGHRNALFNWKIFYVWILFGIFHGFIIFWVPNLGLPHSGDVSGVTKDHWWVSTISFTLLVIIVQLKLFIETLHWNWISILGGVLSVICYYLCFGILSIGSVSQYMETKIPHFMMDFLTNYNSMIIILMAPILAILPDITILFLKRIHFLEPHDIIKRIERNNREIYSNN